MVEISNEAGISLMSKEMKDELSFDKDLLKKLEKEAISVSSADPEKYREKMELYVKQAIKLNGQQIPDLTLEKGAGIDDFVMKYTWTRESGLPRKIETHFTAVYDQGKQNLYLKFTSFQYEKSDKPGEMMVPSANPFQIKNTSIFYDYFLPTENVKTADIRIEKNDKKQFEYLLDRVRAYSFESKLKIAEIADLEKTQLTGLNKVSLGDEITKIPGGGFTRSVFMFDAKAASGTDAEMVKIGKYRELAKVYFTAEGDLDTEKTKVSLEAVAVFVLNQKLLPDISWDMTSKKITLNALKNVEDLTAKVKSHRETLISAINGGSGQWIEADFPGIVKSVYNEKENKWSFDSKKLRLNIIDDTYTFQRGASEDQILKFGFDQANALKLKDMTGKMVDKIILPVQNAEGKTEYYRVKLIDKKLEIIVPKKFEIQSPNELPTFTGDGATSITASKLYYYGAASKNIEFYDQKGLLISDIPANRNDNNEWLLGNPSTDVDLYDLFDVKNFDAATMKDLGLFESDIFNSFTTLFKQEKLRLSDRKVVKIFDATAKKNKYYEIDQRGTSAFVLASDKELEETTTDVNETIKTRLTALKNIKDAKVTYKKLDGTEKDFINDLAGSELGLGRGSIMTSNKKEFLKGTTDKINQKLMRQNGAGVLDFVFTMNDAKLAKINISRAKIGPQEYDVSYKQDATSVSLVFSPKKMKE